MNIFVLDLDQVKCAEYHNSRHVVKMILETTQLLNNVLVKHDSFYLPIYKVTHQNHPCSIWASESVHNFDWLNKLGLALCTEYTYRYGKIHKCQEYLQRFTDPTFRMSLPHTPQTPHVKCMPDEYKVEDVVESYRNYYRGAKQHLAVWAPKRDAPEWYYKKEKDVA